MTPFTETFEIELFNCDQECVVSYLIDDTINIVQVALKVDRHVNYNSKGEYVNKDVSRSVNIMNVLSDDQIAEIELWIKDRNEN
jgi:hypothetical protein